MKKVFVFIKGDTCLILISVYHYHISSNVAPISVNNAGVKEGSRTLVAMMYYLHDGLSLQATPLTLNTVI